MKLNKIILAGLIFILFGGLLFITDALNPIIRPITYLFLMGSSKGKDILFFVLFGLFLILSQIYKIKNIKFKSDKFLAIVIVSSAIIFTIAIGLEILLRLRLGIELNTIFVNVRPTFSTTSILHSHLTKSILGQLLTNTINPIIESNINTAVGLYTYINKFTVPLAILILLLFFCEIFALQKRKSTIVILLSFFETILLIGCFDGGIMGIPGALGFVGCIWIYFDEKLILLFQKELSKNKNPIIALKEYIIHYEINIPMKNKIKRFLPYLIAILIVLLRISISMFGATTDYYIVDIINPEEDVNLTDTYPVEYVYVEPGKTTYHIDSSLNENNLTNELSKSLNNSCDYYTVSWNFYSYF